MKLLAAILLALGACGPAPKPESPIVNEGSDTPETCCCKSFPLTSEDGKAVYESIKRMECSARQGECVSDVQCKKTEPDSSAPAPAPSAGSGSGG